MFLQLLQIVLVGPANVARVRAPLEQLNLAALLVVLVVFGLPLTRDGCSRCGHYGCCSGDRPATAASTSTSHRLRGRSDVGPHVEHQLGPVQKRPAAQ